MRKQRRLAGAVKFREVYAQLTELAVVPRRNAALAWSVSANMTHHTVGGKEVLSYK